jgi:hypothetical protein
MTETFDIILDDQTIPGHFAAFRIILKDFIALTDYIEPHEDNYQAYSHRNFELFLRICTEFESICKDSLRQHNVKPQKNDYCVIDYHKINANCRIAEYSVRLDAWRGDNAFFASLGKWKSTHTLPWYAAYNAVKHNRHHEFRKALLENLVNSLAGLLTCPPNADPRKK